MFLHSTEKEALGETAFLLGESFDSRVVTQVL